MSFSENMPVIIVAVVAVIVLLAILALAKPIRNLFEQF